MSAIYSNPLARQMGRFDHFETGRSLVVLNDQMQKLSEQFQVRCLVGGKVQGEGDSRVLVGGTVLWSLGFSTQSGARSFMEKRAKEWVEG